MKKPEQPNKATPPQASSAEKPKQVRVSQADVPAYSIDEALRVSTALFDNYAGGPTTPMNVAAAMGLTPSSSHFRMLTGAALAYGLTDGGYNSATIAITELARRIHSPLEEDQDLLAKRQAFVKPKIISEFLLKYNGHAIPKQPIAGNVLVDLGVPRERAETVLELIVSSAKDLGLIREIKGKLYGDLDAGTHVKRGSMPKQEAEIDEDELEGAQLNIYGRAQPKDNTDDATQSATKSELSLSRKVFITHGKNKAFVDPIKRLLSFGEMEAVVSVDRQAVSLPVPDKVMEDMRSCGAAIIHVDGEQVMLDKDASEHVVLNPNVLIEIGAAMALYKRRFILLVRNGVKLPSNLQGLYEVRYDSDTLDGDATIRLLEAINELKKRE